MGLGPQNFEGRQHPYRFFIVFGIVFLQFWQQFYFRFRAYGLPDQKKVKKNVGRHTGAGLERPDLDSAVHRPFPWLCQSRAGARI